MWYKVEPGATNKRVITADDARGVCAIYPPSAAAPTCDAEPARGRLRVRHRQRRQAALRRR